LHIQKRNDFVEKYQKLQLMKSVDQRKAAGLFGVDAANKSKSKFS